MELVLTRIAKRKTYTIGRFYIKEQVMDEMTEQREQSQAQTTHRSRQSPQRPRLAHHQVKQEPSFLRGVTAFLATLLLFISLQR
jgi:hypothetical protein